MHNDNYVYLCLFHALILNYICSTQSEVSPRLRDDTTVTSNVPQNRKKPRTPSDTAAKESKTMRRHKSATRGGDASESDSTESASSVSSRDGKRGRPKHVVRRANPRPEDSEVDESDSNVNQSEKSKPSDTTISFDTIENAASVSLEVCSDAGNVVLLLKGYVFLNGPKFNIFSYFYDV